jgi:hypothetical protein
MSAQTSHLHSAAISDKMVARGYKTVQPSPLFHLSSMPLLTRPETRASVHSWWSDSNPSLKGPTINLHAAAKPLLRFMHQRQALEFIRKNKDTPLSTTVDIYMSYLPYVCSFEVHCLSSLPI